MTHSPGLCVIRFVPLVLFHKDFMGAAGSVDLLQIDLAVPVVVHIQDDLIEALFFHDIVRAVALTVAAEVDGAWDREDCRIRGILETVSDIVETGGNGQEDGQML